MLSFICSLFAISFFVVLPLCFSANYTKFIQCSHPFECGTTVSNLSYPFWGNGRAEYCGHPDFKLDCKDDGIVELEVGLQSYRVLDFDEENHILHITTTEFLKNCPSPSQNISLPSPMFNYSLPGTVNLTLAYGCPRYPQPMPNNRYPCSVDDISGENYYWVDPATACPDFSKCNLTVTIPVLRTVAQNFNRAMDILKGGIEVRYDANNSFCRTCQLSQCQCGYDITSKAPTCFCHDGQHQGSCPKKGPSRRNKALIGVGAGLGSILLTCIVFIVYKRLKRKRSSSSSALISRDLSRDSSSLKPDPEKGGLFFETKLFTYKELDEATNHFDSSKELGDGGFGTVYHGKLHDGRVVAVKRLYEHNYKRVEQFMNEIAILSRLRHQNLVSLYGCTSRHSRELLLVYEFVPNGTVADHLHGERVEEGLLTWPIRMSIAIQSADALAYLHASEIIHRDVKSNNILLDNNFHVKVADFGLSRLFPTDVTHVSTAPQGTPGYVDPEYYQCYQLTNKSDVYSFGVVLIELISSKPAVDIGRHRHEINLANMAVNRIHNQALHELVDPSLGYDTDYSVRNMITLVAELAFRCLQQENEMRPGMTEVLEILRGIEKEEYKKRKTDDMDTSAVARLLKTSEPLSPDTVTTKWLSKESTPNTSG